MGLFLPPRKRKSKTGSQNEKMKNFFGKATAKGTTWHFNPPYEPLFGGAWKSLFRTAKSAIVLFLHRQTTNVEVLTTALTLLDGHKSRPLIHVSVYPNEPEALTPYHFLSEHANPYIPFNIVDDSNLNSRQRYRAALTLAK